MIPPNFLIISGIKRSLFTMEVERTQKAEGVVKLETFSGAVDAQDGYRLLLRHAHSVVGHSDSNGH